MPAKAPQKKNLSALKRARQTEKRNERNRMARTRVKNVIKAVEKATADNDAAAANDALKAAMKTISSTANKGILHPNNAARKISRLTRKVNAVSEAGTA